MDDLQYEKKESERNEKFVLNLIINGWPSILITLRF